MGRPVLILHLLPKPPLLLLKFNSKANFKTWESMVLSLLSLLLARSSSISLTILTCLLFNSMELSLLLRCFDWCLAVKEFGIGNLTYLNFLKEFRWLLVEPMEELSYLLDLSGSSIHYIYPKLKTNLWSIFSSKLPKGSSKDLNSKMKLWILSTINRLWTQPWIFIQWLGWNFFLLQKNRITYST